LERGRGEEENISTLETEALKKAGRAKGSVWKKKKRGGGGESPLNPIPSRKRRKGKEKKAENPVLPAFSAQKKKKLKRNIQDKRRGTYHYQTKEEEEGIAILT